MSDAELTFPFDAPPLGIPTEVAPGLRWLRLPLPFALNHVNIWLFDEGDGWTVIDSGIDTPDSRAAWTSTFGLIGGAGAIKRVIVTHHHLDHIGLADWLQRETGCDILMSAPEVAELDKSLRPDAVDRQERLAAHYRWLGCAAEEAERTAQGRTRIERYVSGKPERIRTIGPGDTVTLAGHDYAVSTGNGHTAASLILTRRDNRLMIIGDQILAQISPFVGALMNNRDDNPLNDYLTFLAKIGPTISPETLLLPGHRGAFRGGATRAAALIAHHQARCAEILAACADQPISVRGLVGVLFQRDLDGVMGLALAETLAHVNYLEALGQVGKASENGILMVNAVTS